MSEPLVVASAVTGGLAVGFLPTLADGARAGLAKRLGLSDRGADYLVRCFYLAWLPGMPLAGWMLDNWSFATVRVVFFGLLACILGIAWLGTAKSTWSALGSLVVLGLGYSAVAVAAIQYMPHALGFRANASAVAALNVGFVFIALGAVAGPWVAGAFERRWGHRQGMLYLSFLLLIPAALMILAPRGDTPESAAGETAVFADPYLWLLAIVILVYFALENCLEFWPEPYLKEIGHGERGLRWSMHIFWLAFILSRLAMGWLPARGWEAWVLLLLVAIGPVMIGNLAGAYESTSGTIGFWIVGLCYGPLLPGCLALVMEHFKTGNQGTALGAMLALSGLDTLIVRPAMSSFTRNRPARSVMRVPAILAWAMAAALLVLAIIK